ncbi:serine-rich adhesin for platelets-like [Centruroides vittatus]|uniref:serine-rich adhesin for platelets-like n=1 Tax=Centruroides vittatus TaxID=120091 RepID=UPI0035100BDC
MEILSGGKSSLDQNETQTSSGKRVTFPNSSLEQYKLSGGSTYSSLPELKSISTTGSLSMAQIVGKSSPESGNTQNIVRSVKATREQKSPIGARSTDVETIPKSVVSPRIRENKETTIQSIRKPVTSTQVPQHSGPIKTSSDKILSTRPPLSAIERVGPIPKYSVSPGTSADVKIIPDSKVSGKSSKITTYSGLSVHEKKTTDNASCISNLEVSKSHVSPDISIGTISGSGIPSTVTPDITSSPGSQMKSAEAKSSQHTMEDISNTWPWSVNQLVRNKSAGNLLHIEFDLRGYPLEEIRAGVVNNCLMVRAKKATERKERSIQKEFNYDLRLPEGTEAENIKIDSRGNGFFILHGPLPSAIERQ